jgi:hypothetical protein
VEVSRQVWPLEWALWNTVNIDEDAYVAQYHGHGQTKFAYKLIYTSGASFHDRVLKVVCPPKKDPEVITMKHLNGSEAGMCVQILRENHVSTTKYNQLPA